MRVPELRIAKKCNHLQASDGRKVVGRELSKCYCFDNSGRLGFGLRSASRGR
jgi:hypothetical protein